MLLRSDHHYAAKVTRVAEKLQFYYWISPNDVL
jgi:hypothetical protein